MPPLMTRNILFFALGGAAGAGHGASFAKGESLVAWVVGSVGISALLFILGLVLCALALGSNERG